MKIQLETREDNTENKPSSTYVSYSNYKALIPKAPENVKLSDVKNAFPETEKPNLEYYFKTKNDSGNIVLIEVYNDDQSIPLLDGMIKVETAPKKTEVCFRIRDQKRNRLEKFCFGYLEHGVIPKAMKKSKTLGDVKNVIPSFLQQILNGGRNVKYFFEEGTGGVRKELIQDHEEIPIINGRKKIICWIVVSPDICKKLNQRKVYIWLCTLSSLALILATGLSCSICFSNTNDAAAGFSVLTCFLVCIPISIALTCISIDCPCDE